MSLEQMYEVSLIVYNKKGVIYTFVIVDKKVPGKFSS